MVTRVALPTRPSVEARKGTLLDAATVVPEFAGVDGIEAFWNSYNSLKFQESAEFCGPNVKDFDQSATWTGGWRFAVYGGVTCKAIGLNQDDMRNEVARVFAMGESTAVERALMSTRFVADAEVGPDTNPLDRWDAPVDITPTGGAVSPKAGIALLEGWMGDNYVPVATLHVPLTIASLILGVDGAVFTGSMLRTKFGSKIAAGAGYDFPNTGPTGAAAAAGEKWIYASGEVVIGRGEAMVKQSMETSNNDVFVMGERGYIAAVDGPTVAVRVKVE